MSFASSKEVTRQLAILRRQVLQRLSLIDINWPEALVLRDYDVQKQLFLLLNSTTKKEDSELASRWEKRLWVEFGKRIERAVTDAVDADIFDPIMETCAMYQAIPVLSEIEESQRDVWITYAAGSTDPLKDMISIQLLEKPRMLSGSGHTGHRTWEAALALGTEMIRSRTLGEKLKNKRVLELGAGTGFLSFLCAADHPNRARRVVATDGDVTSINRILVNNQRNGHGHSSSESSVVFGVYRWGQPFEGTIIASEMNIAPFDVVLGADVVRPLTVCPRVTDLLTVSMPPDRHMILRLYLTWWKLCRCCYRRMKG